MTEKIQPGDKIDKVVSSLNEVIDTVDVLSGKLSSSSATEAAAAAQEVLDQGIQDIQVIVTDVQTIANEVEADKNIIASDKAIIVAAKNATIDARDTTQGYVEDAKTGFNTVLSATSDSVTLSDGSSVPSLNKRVQDSVDAKAAPINTAVSTTQQKANEAANSASQAAASAQQAQTISTNVGIQVTAAQAARTGAEAARDTTLTYRDSALTARDQAISAKTDAETARDVTLGYRDTTQGFVTQAQTAKTGAETARDTALTYRDSALTAKTGAETARDTTISYRDAALAAKTDAETARDVTLGYRDSALTYRDQSLQYANDAQSFKNAAQQSSIDASSYMGQAQTYQAAALNYKNAAEVAAQLVGMFVAMYPDITTGLAAVTDGKYFSTPGTNTGEYSVLYRRTNSTTAQEISRYPSSVSLNQILQALVFSNPDGYVFSILDSVKRAAVGIRTDGTFEAAKALIQNLTITQALTQLQLKGYDLYVGDNALLTARYVKPGFLIDIQDVNGNTSVALKEDGTLYVANLEILNNTFGTATGQPNFDAEVNHVDSNGQSLSNGTSALPVITTTQRFDSWKFNGGVRNTDGGDTNQNQIDSHASLVPLTETASPDNALGETPVSGACEQVKELILSENGIAHTQQSYRFLGSASGYGGMTIQQLNDSHYFRLYNSIFYGYQRAKEMGKTYRFQAMFWAQGEEDDAAKTDIATYKLKLKAYLNRALVDIKAITGQTRPFKFITYQPVSHEHQGFGMDGTPRSALALLQYANEDANAYLACPNYMFPRAADGGHLTNVGSKWMGAYFGIVYKRTVIDGKEWTPLQPMKAYVENKIVMVEFNVPKPPLVFDTTTVNAHATKGFRLINSVGTELAISNVEIVNQRYVKITAAADIPTGSFLQYAFKSDITTNPNRNGPTDGPRGNLRDSQGDTIRFDPTGINKRMDNWCVLFQMKIN